MKFKVFKVTRDKEQTLEYQLELKETRSGISQASIAADYIMNTVTHKVSDRGVSPLADSYGVHLTQWIVLDDKDIYWVIPASRFVKKPEPIEIGDALGK